MANEKRKRDYSKTKGKVDTGRVRHRAKPRYGVFADRCYGAHVIARCGMRYFN